MDSKLTQLTDNLWVTQSRGLRMNSGLFISQGEACLIDPGLFPDEIDGLAQFVAEQKAVPGVIVLTHWHWDHLLGPERLPDVNIAAHKLYLVDVADSAADVVGEIEGWRAKTGQAAERPFKIPLPDALVADGDTIALGDLDLRVRHVPGHSADQIALYQPQSGALWASDILSDIEIPLVSDSLAAYESTLARLSHYDIRVLVPGHGSPATSAAEVKARIEADRAYLANLRQTVTEAVAAGKTVEETVAEGESLELHTRSENKPYHRLNIESVYIELGGQADPGRVGWRQKGIE